MSSSPFPRRRGFNTQLLFNSAVATTCTVYPKTRTTNTSYTSPTYHDLSTDRSSSSSPADVRGCVGICIVQIRSYAVDHADCTDPTRQT